jgi:hypothetical protein
MLHIYTVCYNTPEFIDYQYMLLKKHISDDFTFYIFNNTQTHGMTHNSIMNNYKLTTECNKHKLRWFDVPADIFIGHPSDPSSRAGIAIDYSTQFLISHIKPDSSPDDIMFLLDSDAFLVTDFNVSVFMTNTLLSGREQYRNDKDGNTIKYITNQIVIFKPFRLEELGHIKYLSFKPVNINGASCDCGGMIHYILQDLNVDTVCFKNWHNMLFSDQGNHYQKYGGSPNLKEHYTVDIELKPILKQYITDDTSLLKKSYPFCEIFVPDNSPHPQFLHLRAGTNWIGYNINARKQLLFGLLEYIKQ